MWPMIKMVLLYGMLAGSCVPAFSQHKSGMQVSFYPMFANTPFVLEDGGGIFKVGLDTFQFDALKFYISNIQFMQNEKMVYKEENSCHLMDATDEHSFTFSLNTPANIRFNTIKFNVGIDSSTNVAGALGGDLDPTKGMYWTWQSGYINFKLEGSSKIFAATNRPFQFHIGGYKFPFDALQTVTLKLHQKGEVNILLDIKKVLESVDFKKHHQIMSPGRDAVKLSAIIAKCFRIK